MPETELGWRGFIGGKCFEGKREGRKETSLWGQEWQKKRQERERGGEGEEGREGQTDRQMEIEKDGRWAGPFKRECGECA